MKSGVGTSRVSSKGQVIIPESVRSALQVEKGDRLEWSTKSDGSCVVRKIAGRLEDLVGILGVPSRHVSLDEMDAAVRERLGARRARR